MEKRVKSCLKGIEKFGILVICMTMILVTGMLWKENTRHSTEIEKVPDGWYYFNNGKKEQVTLPATIKQKEGRPLTLYYDLDDDNMIGKMITTKGAEYHLEIFANGMQIYEYREDGFRKNAAMRAKVDCNAEINEYFRDGTLVMEYFAAPDGEYHIPQVYMGSRSDIYNSQYKSVVINVSMNCMMILFAVICVGIYWYLKANNLKDTRILDLAVFLFICAFWSVTDIPTVQQLTTIESLTCYLSFVAFSVMAVPMIYFVRNTLEKQRGVSLDIMIAVFYFNIIIQSILYYLQKYEMVQMLFITHILLFIGVVLCVWNLWKEYKAEKNRDVKSVLMAFAVLGAGGVIALSLYWTLHLSFYEVIFEIGIFAFILLLLTGIVVSITDQTRLQMEMAAYERLAKEDKLTSLGNRRALDEYVLEIQENISNIDNAIMLFFDLNRLKHVNDQYGHRAGDELILGAGRCINNAFEDQGQSFRIGGDEFCTIIINPEETEEELMAKLDREIEAYNVNSEFKVSIARGAEYLKRPDGSMQSISDWKYHADQKMYENKKKNQTK